MELINEFVHNKTSNYLAPFVVNYYQLGKYVRNLYKLKWAIKDTKNKPGYKNCIYLLINIKGERVGYDKYKDIVFFTDLYIETINFLKTKKYYVANYPYLSNDDDLRVLVFRIPKELLSAYKHFKQSEYSKMYDNHKLIRQVCGGDTRKTKVLTKDESYYPTYLKRMKEFFGSSTNIKLEDVKEYDGVLTKKEHL